MDREKITRLAADSGFSADPIEKVIRLGEVAALVSRHPLLSRVLALKGGTALNMFGGPPERLSVDLDFNYVGALDRQEMLEERPNVELAVESIARELKYKTQWAREEHAGRKIFLNYTGDTEVGSRIEIDLNFVQRLPLVPLRAGVMWQPGDINQPEVSLCGLEEIAAGKVCAMLDRNRPRDLYDVIRLSTLGATFWTSAWFKGLVVAFTGTLDHPLNKYGRGRLERVRDIDITSELVPMLGRRASIDRDSLVEEAWQAVAPILALKESELEFVDRLQLGDLQLELILSEESQLRERLAKWPPLQWKVLNARKAKSRGR